MLRVHFRIIGAGALCACFAMACNCLPVRAADPPPVIIGVDTTGIDDRGLPKPVRDAIVAQMRATIKANLDEAFGQCNTTVNEGTTNASRTVTTSNTAPHFRDGNNNHYRPWGQWDPGSANASVYVGRFMDHNASSFQNPDGTWNTERLGRALGNVAAHEIAHSFSAGHTRGTWRPNKMDSSHHPDTLAGDLHLPRAAIRTLRANRTRPPCQTAAYCLDACVNASFWDILAVPDDEEISDPFAIDALFSFGGPLAGQFELGWWGPDGGSGEDDGNPFGNFVSKSSMTGTEDDAESITFFDGWNACFVLRGLPETPYENQHFPQKGADIVLSDLVTRPDGTILGRQVDLSWDVTGDGHADVKVRLTTQGFGTDSPQFSGFTVGPTPTLSVGQSKLRCDGSWVMTEGVVTATFPMSGAFYFQSSDRSSGIRALSMTTMPPRGAFVRVLGSMCQTTDGERVLRAAEVMPMHPLETKPLSMRNSAVGGGPLRHFGGLWPSGQQGAAGRSGANNVGLLVKTWGHVLPLGLESFLVDDGSGTPIECIAPTPYVWDPSVHFAAVTGVASLRAEGDSIRCVLLLRDLTDVEPLF